LQVNPNPSIGNYAYGGGTLDIESKADIYFLNGGNPVQVASGANVTVLMPLPSTTGYVVGDEVQVFHYDTTTSTWSPEVTGIVVTTTDGLGVSFTATHFSVYAIAASPTNTYNRSAGRRDFVNCFITLTGTIACAGETRNNVIGYEPTGTGWLSLAMTSFGHTCALHEDHHVQCWGDFGDPGDVPAASDFVQIAAGLNHICGLHADGAISCWGDNTLGQTNAPSGTGFVEVAAGNDGSCALDANRSPVCWGEDYDAGVFPPPTETGLSQLGMGWYGSCAIKSNGVVGCWGFFGPDAETQIPVPTNVSNVDLLRVGDDSVTVLYPDGHIGSWAATSGGYDYPAPTGTGYLGIGTAQCADTGLGTTECWGSPWSGQTLRTGSGGFVAAAPGDLAGCALRQNGSIACWAYFPDGMYRTAVPSGTGYKGLATDGNDRYCAIKPNDELVCFGATYPTAIVPPSGTFKFVAGTHGDTVQYANGVSYPSGYAYNGNGITWHSGAFCGIRTNGTMACWGNTRPAAKVQTAQPGSDWVSITGGGTRWCAVRTDHTVFCWGVGSFGFIGAANETNVKKLLGADDGIQEACVLRRDGTIGCFGQYATTPPTGSDFVDLAKVHSNYCAVRSTGAMACWPNAAVTPAGNGFVAVFGRSEMAALKSDGSIYVFSEKLVLP
ncbi:MAG: hypothetical protein JNJ59_15620, partial [Deltaproteobacteria bacterium]|nr:hypothetical protein [Deltaproteobacteria bacterium]